jgi:GalNAc5-diNAcBac-PP-undecaprenol beta-1,3-glucosyltransferase
MFIDRKTTVSIIMATYNRAHFIQESLHYIQNQTFEDFECLVIDDGSQDITQDLIYKLSLEDERIKYYKRTSKYSKGLPGCRNFGLNLAQGNYVVFFDDDDIPHPKLLELTIKVIEESGADFCRYGRNVFSGIFQPDFDHSNKYEIENFPENLPELMVTGKIPFNSCQVLWKKSCFDDIRFNEKLLFAEEWECYSRILLKGYHGINLDKVLYNGRKHSNSNTGEFQKKNIIRIASKIEATILVMNHLNNGQKINNQLRKFFIRMAFDLRSACVLEEILKLTNTGLFENAKYKMGLQFYPLLRPLLKIKGRLKST